MDSESSSEESSIESCHVCPDMEANKHEILQKLIDTKFSLGRCYCKLNPEPMCVCRLFLLVDYLSHVPRIEGRVDNNWTDCCRQCYEIADEAHRTLYGKLPTQADLIKALKRIELLEKQVLDLQMSVIAIGSASSLNPTILRFHCEAWKKNGLI